MNYLGDYAVGQIVHIWFNTFTSDDPAASITMTNFANTDVHIYKDASLTQRNNAAGVTVVIDQDTASLGDGIHTIVIDTANNTVADFFEAGHDYAVRIEGVTVDAGTLNVIVATFSIANRRTAGQMAVSSIEGLTDQDTFTLTSGEASADDDAYNDCMIIVTDQVTKIQKAIGYILDYTGSTRSVQLYAVPLATGFIMAVGDSVEIFSSSAFTNVHTVNRQTQTAGDIMNEIGTAGDGLTAINLPNQTMDIAGNLSGSVGSVTGAVGSVAGNVDGSVATVTGDINTSGGTIKTLDDLDTQQDARHTATQLTLQGLILAQGTIGATANDTTHLHLDGLAYADDAINDHLIVLKDVSTGLYYSTWISDFVTSGDLATVNTLPITPEASVDLYWLVNMRQDVTGGSGPSAASIADAVWNEDATAHQTGGTFGQAIGDPGANTETMYDAVITDAASTNIAGDIIIADSAIDAIPTTAMRGTDNSALASVVGAIDDAASAGDPTSSDTLVQYIKQLINVLVGTVGVGTFPAEQAPANAINLAEVIRAIHADVTGLNGDAMRGTNSANTTTPPTVGAIANQVWDEAQADHVAVGSFGITASEIASILVDTMTTLQAELDAIQAAVITNAAGVDIAADIAASKTVVDGLQTDLDNATDGLGALKTLIDALNDISVVDILTTQMTEAYAADGTVPTLAQAIHMILQQAGEFAISGTTITTKKLDGSATAMTHTLDDATNPTSRTRAT